MFNCLIGQLNLPPALSGVFFVYISTIDKISDLFGLDNETVILRI